MSMERVSHRRPCPVCQKPDCCLVAPDGSAAICQRVESERSVGSKSAGWLHRLNDDRLEYRRAIRATPKRPMRKRDWPAIAERYQRAMTPDCYYVLSAELGVSLDALKLIGVGWIGSQSSWTFPMCDASGSCGGIRTRGVDGSKLSVSGSDGNGLFFVPGKLSPESLIVCEGPTDAAALVDCGFCSVIGRPSCKLGNQYIVAILERLKPAAVLLIPDNDEAGLSGFSELANDIIQGRALELVRLDALTPPKGVNDIRDWARKSRKHLGRTVAAKLEVIKQRITEGNDE